MKVVLDSNVIIAAFVSRGLSSAVFELCLDRFEIIMSTYIINEISKMLSQKIKLPQERIGEIVDFLKDSATFPKYKNFKKSVCRDKEDDETIALAKWSQSNYIVTGDKDLLVLKKFEDIKIITPRQLWEISKEIGFYY